MITIFESFLKEIVLTGYSRFIAKAFIIQYLSQEM